MEETRSPETSIYIKPTRRLIPEDGILKNKQIKIAPVIN
jgi:hypothetical protein